MGVGVSGVDAAAGCSTALSRQDPVTGRVADVDGTVRPLDTVLVAAAPLAGVASDGGGGEKANSEEGTSEIHFVVVVEEYVDGNVVCSGCVLD